MKKTRPILMLVMILMIVAVFVACAAPIPSIAEGVTVGNQSATDIIADLCTIALRVALLVISVILTKVLFPYLEKKGLMWLVRMYVRSAEKQGETGAIRKEKKKAFVLKALKSLGIEPSPLVENMIEAAVEELDAFGSQLGDMIEDDAPPDELDK